MILPCLLLFIPIINNENFQLEGVVLIVMVGLFSKGFIHYAIAKIFGPLIWGRGFCGWACWTAAILDWLPIRNKKKKVNLKNTVGLALVTVLFIVGFMVNQSIQNNIILTSLDKQLEEIKIHMGPLEKVDLEYETLQKYTNAINKIDDLNPTKLQLLLELSKVIPKDTWLKKIRFKNTNIELNGISKNASQLVPIVEKPGKFRDTHFVGTIITESMGEKFTINTAVGTK